MTESNEQNIICQLGDIEKKVYDQALIKCKTKIIVKELRHVTC